MGSLVLYFNNPEPVYDYEVFAITDSDRHLDPASDLELLGEIYDKFDVFETDNAYIDSLHAERGNIVYFQLKGTINTKGYNYYSEKHMEKLSGQAFKLLYRTAKKVQKILTPYGFIGFYKFR